MTQWNDKRNNMDRISAFRPNKSNYMYPCLSGKNSNVMKIILDKRNIIIIKRRKKLSKITNKLCLLLPKTDVNLSIDNI